MAAQHIIGHLVVTGPETPTAWQGLYPTFDAATAAAELCGGRVALLVDPQACAGNMRPPTVIAYLVVQGNEIPDDWSGLYRTAEGAQEGATRTGGRVLRLIDHAHYLAAINQCHALRALLVDAIDVLATSLDGYNPATVVANIKELDQMAVRIGMALAQISTGATT